VDFSNYKTILFRRDGKVLHATLNRPEVHEPGGEGTSEC